MPSKNAARPKGLLTEFLSLTGSVGRHIQALLDLAGEESKEALALYLRLAIMLGAALVFLVFGYVLSLLFVVFVIEALFQISWVWITLALALLHFVVAYICANHVRKHFRSPIFEITRRELKKDFETLSGKSE